MVIIHMEMPLPWTLICQISLDWPATSLGILSFYILPHICCPLLIACKKTKGNLLHLFQYPKAPQSDGNLGNSLWLTLLAQGHIGLLVPQKRATECAAASMTSCANNLLGYLGCPFVISSQHDDPHKSTTCY